MPEQQLIGDDMVMAVNNGLACQITSCVHFLFSPNAWLRLFLPCGLTTFPRRHSYKSRFVKDR
jgi:hypothetical protein